ncbi:hypothetical protein [Microbulbifer sp. VAAF005]|uniref:hypothetical protein n=1 Tax=Microbulbifer sp. VAAF005 TaxID=3034230 RepID=UPI0024AC8B98|nr:hypothetical protein [Microbulbifer sp. VAAF005]WHI48483.1 hypothetical protein P0078_08950 [Microbulbifer sp. VAAF005]
MKSYLSAVCILATIFLGELAYTADTSTLQSSGDVSSTEIETITISSDSQITPEDKSLDGRHIRIDGAILTIDGAHTFSSLILENNATLTHSISPVELLSLTINGDIEIQSGSKIDVSARGTLSTQLNCSGCGGAHASYGGGRGQEPYGDYVNPKSLGSGGNHSSDGMGGTRGGGAVQIQAQSLLLDGSIDANGQSIIGNSDSGYFGGGSGGAVLLSINVISGSGSISASGGQGNTGYSDGGSGGRVALHYQSSNEFDISNRIFAVGGDGRLAGGPGTIFLSEDGVKKLEIKNHNAENGTLAPWVVEEGAPALRSGGPDPHVSLGGAYYFYGGANVAESKFYQNIDFDADSNLEQKIDDGKISINASWIQSAWDEGNDEGQIILRFLNESGGTIIEESSGLTDTAEKTWEDRIFNINVPSGARSVDLVVHSSRKAGSNSDGYFDNFELKLLDGSSIDDAGSFSSDQIIIDNFSSDEYVEKFFVSGYLDNNLVIRNASVELDGEWNTKSFDIRGIGNSRLVIPETTRLTSDNFIVDGYLLKLSGILSSSGHISVQGNSVITSSLANSGSSQRLIEASTIYVAPTAKIDMSGTGLPPLEGGHWKSGGSFGGAGGKDPLSGSSNTTFGSLKSPTDFGVGGYGADISEPGSRGRRC